jgi:Outer membrane protein beta-barrel domain
MVPILLILYICTQTALMKRTTSLVTALFLISTAAAQVKIAAKGGWNYASTAAVYAGIKQPSGYISGYGMGVLLKVPFDGVLNFSPSVMINKRGFIIEPLTGVNKKEQYSITYVDLIPSLSVDFPVKSNSFAISLGPDFGFTNFGKLKTTDTANLTSTQKLKFGYGGYGWFDIGLNASIGYHTKKIFVEAGYLYGLASINNNEELDLRNIRNRMFSINVGYYFR